VYNVQILIFAYGGARQQHCYIKETGSDLYLALLLMPLVS
jgi:hypothetical protein